MQSVQYSSHFAHGNQTSTYECRLVPYTEAARYLLHRRTQVYTCQTVNLSATIQTYSHIWYKSLIPYSMGEESIGGCGGGSVLQNTKYQHSADQKSTY